MKAEVRSSAMDRRNNVDDETRAVFAAHILAVGPPLALAFAPAGKTLVASFSSAIGSEPDTMPLALALHDAGVDLALPVDWSHGTPLVFRRWLPGDRLAAGPLGIAEPTPNAPEIEPDVLFIPMVAYDRRGHRIGYGAGNVDRTLRALRGRKAVRVIGIAFATQEVLVVPTEGHDEPVDFVVTEREVIACQNGAMRR